MDLLDFDLSHDAQQGSDVHLRDPRTDEPLFSDDGSPVAIGIVGAHSDAYSEARQEISKRFLGWPPGMLDNPFCARHRESAEIDLLVALTTGWQGIRFDGVELDCNDTAAAAVYRRFAWIREQVTRAVHDAKQFPATRSTWT